jgi:hypothetical protein
MTELFFPEERRSEFTPEPWDGVSFRHYRDSKIACIEHYLSPAKPIGARSPVESRRPDAYNVLETALGRLVLFEVLTGSEPAAEAAE